MRTIRLRCETRSEIDGRVRREYGDAARVVAVEEVLTGGIGGFFARRHLDVSVEIPDPGDAESTTAAPAPDAGHAFSSRSGLARLLEDADADEVYTGFGGSSVAVPEHGALNAGALDAVPLRTPLPGPAAPGAGTSGATPRDTAPLDVVVAPTSPSTTGRSFEALLFALSTDVGTDVSQPPSAPFALTTPEADSAPAAPGSRRAAVRSERTAAIPLRAPAATAPLVLPTEAVPAPGAGPLPGAVSPPPLFRVSSRAPAAPTPLSGPGDLVVVAGFTQDALEAAVLVGRLAGCDQVFDAGTVRGNSRRRVDDRRSAIVARAAGVQSGRAAVVAFGLDPAAGGVEALAELEPDQLWLAVDVSRKVADTDLWVGLVRRRVRIDGIVPTGELFTASPETIDLLGLPVLRGGGAGHLPPTRA